MDRAFSEMVELACISIRRISELQLLQTLELPGLVEVRKRVVKFSIVCLCRSWKPSNAEHFSVFFLHLYLLFCALFVQIPCPFLFDKIFLCSMWSSLTYILHISWKYFLPLGDCPSVFLSACFDKHRFFIFTKTHCSVFNVTLFAVLCLKQSFLPSNYADILSCLSFWKLCSFIISMIHLQILS